MMPVATDRALLKDNTLQPMVNSPLLAFPEGRAPEGLLWALEAPFPVGDRVADEPHDVPKGPPDHDVDLNVAVEAGANGDDEYLLT